MCSKSLLLENKKKLLEKRKVLIEEIKCLRKEMGANGHENGDDAGDIGNKCMAKEEACGIIERYEKDIEQINKALMEIDNNSYGKCKICGCHISKARLQAANEALTCEFCAPKAVKK